MDISREGIAIKTNNVFAPGTIIQMMMTVNEKVATAQGKVKWAKRVPPALIRTVKCGMGIQFIMKNQDLEDYLQEIDPD